MKKIIVITVRVDSETADAISLLAQTHDRSVAWVTRKLITEALEAVERRSIPGWLELEKETFEGSVQALPTREDIQMPIQEQLIVELYSR